MFSDMTTDS